MIDDDQPVDNSDIVKGYEYSKGKYVIVEPDQVKQLRIETNKTIDISQFVNPEKIPPCLFEKPYFIVPDPRVSVEALFVVRDAMVQANRFAIGKIAFAP